MVPDPVTATVHIDAPPERVWAYLTQPEAIVRWMGEYALLEPQPGGQFSVDVKGAPVRGRFLRLDPPHRLLISWGYAGSDPAAPRSQHGGKCGSPPTASGPRVDVEHRDLPSAEQPGHATGWTHYLARLSAATVGDAGPDPGMGDTASSQAELIQRRAYPRP